MAIADRRFSLPHFVLLAYCLLALPHAFATPIFEKSDEVWHFAFAHHLAHGGGLPVQTIASRDAPWAQEGSQPPLYYALASLVIRLFDTDDFDAQRQPNAAPLYNPYAPGNKNVLIITPEKRAFNYRDTTLAAFVLRLLGILPGCITIWLTFKLARIVTGDRRIATLAMSSVAFNPMFLTVTTAVSNDGLAITLATAGLYVFARAIADGVTLRHAIAFGVLIGLASLTKVSGLVLMPLAGLMLIAPHIAPHPGLARASSTVHRAVHGEIQRAAQYAAALALAWLLIAGWWYARNLVLYGEPTGTAMMALVAHPRTITPWQALSEFEGLRMSYLAMFGHFNVPADDIVYVAFDVLLVLGGVGLIAHVVRRQRAMHPMQRLLVGALAAYALLTFAAVVRWTMMTPASQGRLLFPSIAAIATLTAIGLCHLKDRRVEIGGRLIAPFNRLSVLAAGGLITVAAVAPFRYIIPAYTPPYIAALPADMTPVTQRLGLFAEIIGVGMTPREARPGDKVRVSVAMRALQPTYSNFSLVVNLFGRDLQPLGRFDTFTGGGLLPSSMWRAGDMWRDTIEFTLPHDAAAPAVLRTQFAFYNHGSGEIATSYDAQGNIGAPLFDGATLLPDAAPIKGGDHAGIARLEDIAALTGVNISTARPGHTLPVTLTWHTLARAPVDFTVFVHLVDDQGRLRAQDDAPPLDGQFPTTRWQSGVIFDDRHDLPLPADLGPGRYRLLIGMYRPADLVRLGAFDRAGKRFPDDSIPAGEVVIAPP